MSQLPYWICIDGERVGVILYSLPRISNAVDGIEPMKLLELARLWINPSVQNLTYEIEMGKVIPCQLPVVQWVNQLKELGMIGK